jgi:hypothetical protein
MAEKANVLVGKYFLGVDPLSGPGIVEAVIDDSHYLVRFESDGGIPESLAVVAISDMARAGGTGQEDEPPPWLFFDTVEQRAKYIAWMNEPPDGPGKPRIVPLRPRS